MLIALLQNIKLGMLEYPLTPVHTSWYLEQRVKYAPAGCGWDEGGDSTEFYVGRICPEVHPLTILYTILSEKVTLSYTFN